MSAISGAAPLPVEVLRFFRALGVELSEIYGLSESSGPMTWAPFRVVPGTVGPPIPGCEVVLGEDGEVLCRGGNVFRGYLDDPDEDRRCARCRRVAAHRRHRRVRRRRLPEDRRPQEGAHHHRGRQEHLTREPRGRAEVVPDDRPGLRRRRGPPVRLCALVLDTEVAPAWARRHGIDATTPAALASNPEVVAEVTRLVGEANRHFSQVEQIKKFTLLPEEWTPDSEELTPTMKLKRRGITAKYAAEIEKMYQR